jgi:hypothetical protein
MLQATPQKSLAKEQIVSSGGNSTTKPHSPALSDFLTHRHKQRAEFVQAVEL